MAKTPPPSDRNADAPVDDEPPALSSEELLGGRREVIIQHGSERYRLRLTSNNKLILVK